MYQFANNASTTLASSITDLDTTLVVASGTGSIFPAPSGANFFHATLADVDGNTEIVRVTARSSDSFTVVRGREGNLARPFSAGDRLELRITAGALAAFAVSESPVLTGIPTADTAPVSSSSNQLATTAFVAAQVANDAPSKTGSGATGTWNINITGSAATAARLGPGAAVDSTATATTQPVSTSNNTLATTAFVAAVLPSGAVMAFARSSAPSGWLFADGSAVSRTTYAALFAAIGGTFGVGNGSTTFNLPDLRGEFIRGFDSGRGADTGRTFGSAQADEFRSHTHPTVDVQRIAGNGLIEESRGAPDVDRYGVLTGAAGGSETRPRNVALLYCIKV